MILHAPQFIWLCLMALQVGKSIALFGQKKKEDYYDWIDVLAAPILGGALLYWGGFFG